MDHHDYGADMQAAELAYAAIDEALSSAREIAAAFVEAHSDHPLRPRVEVGESVGPGDDIVVTFRIVLRLDEDFPVEDWPAEAVADMKRWLRDRIERSPVDQLGWYVSVSARAD